MLTKLTIRNFKRFGDVEVELSNPVVFIGPNNSGKTTAMQALTLWDIGVKRWSEKRAGKRAPEKRSGVTINRRDVFSIPLWNARHLWRDLRVRHVQQVGGKQQTSNVRIDLIVEGISEGRTWTCGMEFDYANEESFYCRPLRRDESSNPDRMEVPAAAVSPRIAFLPPLSGLAATEIRLDQGALNVRIGEGRTAEVLRNLCFRIAEENPDKWNLLKKQIEKLFGVKLEEPRYVAERGEITLAYREHGSDLDLTSSGRGLQQTLLILAYMYENAGAAILLDEPDAHLEILRQRQIFDLITRVAEDTGNQIIAASHSEVLLNEAAEKDLVIAFVGKPHRLGGRRGRSQVRKALAEIGFDQYYLAEQTGWVLYLEGSTDLAILRAFARRLDKSGAIKALERPFVHYVGNQPSKAAQHFHGLREACRCLKGLALFDRLKDGLPENPSFLHMEWRRREIENYLCTQSTLESYARASAMSAEPLPLFASSEIDKRLTAMRESIAEVESAMRTMGMESPWSSDVKVSDDFLTHLFKAYFKKIDLPNLMDKKHFHELADHVPDHEIDSEISQKLDAITAIHECATPLSDQ